MVEGDKMRLKKRERLDSKFFDDVLDKAEELFLAINDVEFPYIVPLNFAHNNGKIYIHSATEGTKLDLIRRDPKVSFSLAAEIVIDVRKSTTYYSSVCGRGIASIVEDREEKRLALDSIAMRYKALCPVPATDANVDRVAILRIDVLELTGKQSA